MSFTNLYKWLLTTGLFFNFCFVFAQQKKIDSLKNILEKYTAKDTNRILLLAELGWSLRNSDINAAFEYNRQAVYLATEIKAEPLLAKIYNQRGVLFRNISDYPEAENRFYEALRIAQKYRILAEEAYAYNNLGDLQRLTGNTQESIKLINQANQIFVKIKDQKGEAYTYIRLSEAYQKIKDYEKSYFFAKKSLEIRKKLNALQDVGASLNRIGDILTVQENYQEALKYYQEAVEIAIRSNDATGKVASLQDIAKVYIRTQNYQKAKEILNECLSIVKKTKNREQERNIYEFFTELYERQKDAQNAYEYYKKKQAIADSVLSNQRMLQMLQMKVRYDINEAEKENEILKGKIKFGRLVVAFGIAFSSLVLLAGLWIYRNSRKIDKFSKEVSKKNEEIRATLENLEQANEAISLKNKEIEQRSIEIEMKNTDLIQSIGYALLLQQAMLPSDEVLERLLKEYFVIWEPKDIVSGDFYWIADKADKIILAVADCTGHGVPGAMMSMLGNNLLNSAVYDKEIYQPHLILQMIHKEIISILHKEYSEITDAMEMAIVMIEKGKNCLHYAGAGMGLYYIDDRKIQYIVPEKTSIGNSHYTDEDFVLHTLEIVKSTQFFLATDGYKDQFGGEQNKKFGIKQFRSMLEEIADRSMQEQKDILTRKLYLWQKAAQEMQTDDITVLSFKLG